MPFQPVVLTTDVLFLLLTAVIIMFALLVRSRPHLQAPWIKVLKRKTGAVSVIVLLCYFIVALLDSLHFHPLQKEGQGNQNLYSNQVLSVLDLVIQPLTQKPEKTYAAPFSWHLYSKETVENEQGQRVRIYPRLEFGGKHLEDPGQDFKRDFLHKLLNVAIFWAILWLGVWMVLLYLMSRRCSSSTGYREYIRRVLHQDTEYPWLSVMITTGIIVFVIVFLVQFSRYYHVFGTDKIGQDVLYQAIKSVRTGILIGTLTTLVMLPFAIALGVSAGYFRGWVDDIVQYIYTTLSSIPGVLLIAAAVLMLQVYMTKHADDFANVVVRADLRLLCLCLILGVTSWTSLCRLLRAETLKLREMEYIQAAHAFGVRHFRILVRHLIPNVMHIVLITIVLDFSSLVLAEAVLSYINIGVDPSMNSWGNMINQARLEMAREPVVWWSLAAAFIFMFILVLFANLFADAVRDALDPRETVKD